MYGPYKLPHEMKIAASCYIKTKAKSLSAVIYVHTCMLIFREYSCIHGYNSKPIKHENYRLQGIKILALP